MTHHVVPIKVYLGVFVALMLLMAATIFFAYMDLGIFNNVVALVIAISKTVLIMLFFMHLRYSSRLTQIFAVIGFVFLVILVAFTLSDYFTRGDFSNIAPTLGNPYDPLGGN
ncbi:MAG: cytochrome C oxidase subunit IV family protein [Chloroflexi bacterium]|nr:cytochrome C oxidase subunit IV family protein [Chloroflexota bacterium]